MLIAPTMDVMLASLMGMDCKLMAHLWQLNFFAKWRRESANCRGWPADVSSYAGPVSFVAGIAMNLRRFLDVSLAAFLFAFAAGCTNEVDFAVTKYGNIHYKDIKFNDQPVFRTEQEQTAPAEKELQAIDFIDTTTGQPANLKSFKGKPVVFVITRGNTSPICVYCSTQTSRLIHQYEEFKSRGAEVVVVYPIAKSEDRAKLDEFLAATRKKLDAPPEKIPFPLWLDVGLAAVDRLGIRQELSKPSTYIFDAEGRLRYAYVGGDLTDRPSIKAMLAKLDELKAMP